MKRQFAVSVALIALVAALLALPASPASADTCSAREYNLYHPLTGERLIAAEDQQWVFGAAAAACVSTPAAGTPTPFIGVIVGASPSGSAGSVGQICWLPVSGGICAFNYFGSVSVTGSPDTTPLNQSTVGGPACVGTVCPSVSVNTGYTVHVESGNYSSAIIMLPTLNLDEPLCVRIGSGVTC